MFPDMLEAMRSAEHFIFLEYFIIEEGYMFQIMADILAEKVREGVEVRTEEAEVARSAVYASDPAVGRYYAGLFHLPVIAPHRPLAEVVVELGPDLLH